MLVDVILTHQSIPGYRIGGSVCIVIDTLRAASTVVTALESGCREIIPADTIEEAMVLKKITRDNYLLGGEKKGVRVEGFDLGNSPLEYSREKIQGRGVVLYTSNGTKALKKAGEKASVVVVCSLLNAGSVIEWLSRQQGSVILCCAGSGGHFSLEDFLTAGRVASGLQQMQDNITFSAAARAAADFYSLIGKGGENALIEILKTGRNGQSLLKKSRERDINYCGRQDIFNVLPFYKNGSVKAGRSLRYFTSIK